MKERSKKYLLETSFQIEKLKSRKREKYCYSYVTNKRLCSSYFTLYEFKTGFVKNLIQFYLLIEITDDVEDALAEWSDKFGAREQKNKVVLEAVMHRVYETISTKNTNDYLGKLESIIRLVLDGFYAKVTSMVGQFAEDEIVKYEINDADDFMPFFTLCEARPCIPQESFWKRNKHNLEKLVKDNDLSRLKKYEKIYKHLVSIEDDIENSGKIKTNKAVGDAVIAIECPKSITVVTFDQSYDYLCPPLNKLHERIDKPPRTVIRSAED